MDERGIEGRYEDCYRLFREYGGRGVTRIEREMRELGHENFSRRILYNRTERGVRKPGWIERYSWKTESGKLKTENAGVSSSIENRQLKIENKEPSSSILNSQFPTLNSQFPSWLNRVFPSMRWDWPHQKLLYEYLEAVTKGECRRLMIFMPPRHGKSELVTVRYTAWRMQQKPKTNVILASYNQRLANRFSRKVRRALAEAAPLSEPPAVAGGCTRTSIRTDGQKPFGTSDSNTGPQPPATAGGSDTRHRPRFANSESEWETRTGGGLRAVGVGSGVTGFGADLIVIDDPVKSRAEAESKTFRDNLYDWFNDDIYTRLEPNGSIILIQTRWHQDDLAGRLLNEMKDGGEHWDVLALPALAETDPCSIPDSKSQIPDSPSLEAGLPANAFPSKDSPTHSYVSGKPDSKPIDDLGSSSNLESEIWNLESKDQLNRAPGQALCPDRYNEAALEKLKKKLGSYSFSALFQQRPTPADGGIFKRKWFSNIVNSPPPGLLWKRGWDLAVSTRTDSDFTASFRCAFDKHGNLYIADGIRLRIEFPEQRRLIIDRLLNEPNTEHGVELAIHGQAIIQDLRRLPSLRRFPLRGVRVATDKITRALAWAPLAEDGKLFLVRGPWIHDFIHEASFFPHSPHDDQIDAISLAISMLSNHNPPKPHGF